MSTQRTITSAAVAAAVAIAGCGGGSSSSSLSSSSPKPAAPMTTDRYVALVKGASDQIDAARSAYFHGSAGTGAQRRSLQQVESAYRSAIAHLQGVTPPVAGRAIHGQILAAMRKLSGALASVLAGKPFKPARAQTLLYRDSDRLSATIEQVYTIP